MEREKALKLFMLVFLCCFIVFSIFFLIQEKKDQDFERSRQGILQLIEKINPDT